MTRTLSVYAAAAALLGGGCLIVQQPPAAGTASAATPSSTPTSATPAPTAATTSPAAAPAPPTPTTVEVHSDCGRTVSVFYGDKPKFGSGTKSSVGANTTTSATRKADGTLMVWIVTDAEDPVASATVTPATRRVTIDRSCNALVAR